MAVLYSCEISILPSNRGDIFIIMGGSGCGKSTLLKILIGLKEAIPRAGFLQRGKFLGDRSQ